MSMEPCRKMYNVGVAMAVKLFDPESILAQNPFMLGITSAFDMYGERGLRAQVHIHERWQEAIAEPVSSAEESIAESIATVNVEFAKLIAEHAE